MRNTDPNRVEGLRALIADFLRKRLEEKLDKIKDDDKAAEAKRIELRRAHQPTNWVQDAARRVRQIQTVTHSLKSTHPDARGTNLYRPPANLTVLDEVGSHCLGPDFARDVVGTPAAWEIYKFLKLDYQGSRLLDLAQNMDADLTAALSDDPTEAESWVRAFAGLTSEPDRLASHTLAKQLYWLTGSDPHDDSQYHLLAPLYASSLVHRVWEQIQDDRFGEAARTARDAQRANAWSDRSVREYPQLAVQKLGGSKPQNISQLNSERRGNNYLLASLPPTWRAPDVRPLLRTDSMYRRYERRDGVRQTVRTLLAFLRSDPVKNIESRRQRNELVDLLIDELLQYAAELRTLDPGWSQQRDCWLSPAERDWLDPEGWAAACEASARPVPTDTAERVSETFANWLNHRLRDGHSHQRLAMGDPEFLEWRCRMLVQIQADERNVRDDD